MKAEKEGRMERWIGEMGRRLAEGDEHKKLYTVFREETSLWKLESSLAGKEGESELDKGLQ